MAKFYPSITEEHAAFLADQPLFFVASAAPEGRVNLSPKGLDGLRVLGPNRVAYLDLTGSGNETMAHLKVDPRITIMVCNFVQPPKIMRLFGTGRSVRPVDPDWAGLKAHFPDLPGMRQIVDVAVAEVQTSCGFGVPLMDLVGQRDTLLESARKKGPEGIRAYWAEKNAKSIDGLETGILDDAE